MTLLSDADILKAINDGRLSIAPFEDKCLTPNGYDLRITEVAVESKEVGTSISRRKLTSLVGDEVSYEGQDKVTEAIAAIPPKTWFAVSTLEYVRLGPEYAAQLWLRTTWARRGIIAQFGMIDAGYEGNLTFTGFNAREQTVELPIGERYAQMVIMKINDIPEKLYAERSGTYQKKKGIQL